MNDARRFNELRDQVARAGLAFVDDETPCVLGMRAGGNEVSNARRDELLAKIAAGEYVEIEVDYIAFEQIEGKRNRNSVRFRDGMLLAFGRSGKGTVWLRDHAQRDQLARGGTVIDSKALKVAEGHYQIRQTARITAPWAVEAFLRGLIDRFSIGWNPTGDVLCSACNKPIGTRCYHYPGDRLREVDEDGSKKLVRDRAGDIVVEWIYTAAELIETSAVSVPAVPGAQIEGIRAAMAALHHSGEAPPEEDTTDMLKTKIIALLGLASTASEDEVSNAVEAQAARLRIVESQHTELTRKHAELSAKQAAQEAAVAAQAEETFIAEAIRAGKIAPKSKLEAQVRAYFQLDAKGAREMVDGLLAATPVGAPPQRKGGDPEPPAGESLSVVAAGLKDYGASAQGVAQVLRALGHADPKTTLTKFGPTALGLAVAQEL